MSNLHFKHRYLMAHFTGETETGEQVYFSLSQDGLHWDDLNRGKPVLLSSIGEMGVRDPYILRSCLDGKFYILATDLRIASGTSWEVARASGSKNMIIWCSDDLISWSEPWTYEVPLEGAGSVWAPECCYDEIRQSYLVFWSSYTKYSEDAFGRFRIYCSHTKDFRDFTAPMIYMERERSIIDSTIIRDGIWYYRFTKDEVTKGIILERCQDLLGSFALIQSNSLSGITGVEGPLTFRMPDGKNWCLMVDQFEKQMGYLPMLCDDLSRGEFKVVPAGDYHLGQTRKRHGSVLTITYDEYDRLMQSFSR